MSPAARSVPAKSSMALLSHLLLGGAASQQSAEGSAGGSEPAPPTGSGNPRELVALAASNHVLVRGLRELLYRGDASGTGWIRDALSVEETRIARAMRALYEISAAFEEQGARAIVIKSLDHWPDMGSDLDLYTDAAPAEVVALMTGHFQATLAERSWGDRLAQKWNFLVPGLPEPVEAHVGRLGQTGEQITIAASLIDRSRLVQAGDFVFRVPSISDRLMISALQRMYRHFYFRLCDIVDTAGLADAGEIDYEDLACRARAAGIWEGMATHLVIVSDYVRRYRGSGLELPASVREAARFGGDRVYFGGSFLRIPVLPLGAGLYRIQIAGVLSRAEFQSGARLSLLPWLATAAAAKYRLTGSDKGIW